MMNEFKVGGYAISTAGHDFGSYYVILQITGEYVYLVDGRIRTLDRPKKKKMKHISVPQPLDQDLADKVNQKRVKNEEIKRAIKLLLDSKSKKEAN
jgi:Ribosomal protein L14E/L6E/L27E